jgi:hypothetical protein
MVLNKELINELKDLFNNGSKIISYEVNGKKVNEDQINNLIDNINANTISNLKKSEEIKKVTTGKGIYFVCKNENDINFITKEKTKINSKGKELPWYEIKELKSDYNDIGETNILYIGKTEGRKKGLRGRIKSYINFGDFNKKSNIHAGGRAIWQIDNVNDLIFCWIEIDNAAEVEKALIESYKIKHNKKRPLANRKDGG